MLSSLQIATQGMIFAIRRTSLALGSRGLLTTILPAEVPILDWARNAFGFDVVWYAQEAPRLPTPYATLHWFSDRPIGFAEQLHTQLALDVEERVQELRQLTVQIEVYAGPATDTATPEALELLEAALLTLQSSEVTREFRQSRIAFLSHETLLNLDEFEGDRWERRALCDVHFLHLLTTDPESVGRIDTATPTYNIS